MIQTLLDAIHRQQIEQYEDVILTEDTIARGVKAIKKEAKAQSTKFRDKMMTEEAARIRRAYFLRKTCHGAESAEGSGSTRKSDDRQCPWYIQSSV